MLNKSYLGIQLYIDLELVILYSRLRKSYITKAYKGYVITIVVEAGCLIL
jgi:hypothetical protein